MIDMDHPSALQMGFQSQFTTPKQEWSTMTTPSSSVVSVHVHGNTETADEFDRNTPCTTGPQNSTH